MANVPSTDRVVAASAYDEYDPPILRRTTDYFIKLLVERHAIRAALENPGGSVIITNVASKVETDATNRYSSMCGNDIHLDLIEAEAIVKSLPGDQRKALLDWVDGLPSRETAQYASVKPRAIRARRQVAVRRAGEAWAKSVAAEVPVA